MEVTLESVQALIKRRDEMEDAIKVTLELLSGYGVGLDKPLVDEEGYPLSGLDLPSIRAARHSVYCLRNDIKDIIQEIDQGLEVVHGKARKAAKESQTSGCDTGPSVAKRYELEPFARIGNVAASSPADRAGLLEGDLVLKFGSVNKLNFTGIAAVGALVSSSEDRPIQVAVFRDNVRKDVILKPQRWKGQGLLGCFITGIAKHWNNVFYYDARIIMELFSFVLQAVIS